MVVAGLEVLTWIVTEIDPEFGRVFGVGVRETVAHIFPDFAVVGLGAEALLVGGLPGPDYYVVWEGDYWDGEGWGVLRGDGGVWRHLQCRIVWSTMVG